MKLSKCWDSKGRGNVYNKRNIIASRKRGSTEKEKTENAVLGVWGYLGGAK